MVVDESALSHYSSYLALDKVLRAQLPRSDEHDEMLFIVAHQVHELWFKELLHELGRLQQLLADGDSAQSLHTLRRSVVILGVITSPIDVLETLTSRQFNSFRSKLGDSSGFQSAQFREIEAVLGRRDPQMCDQFPDPSDELERIRAAMTRPSVYDSFVAYLAGQGHAVPEAVLNRDVTTPPEPSPEMQGVLAQVYYGVNDATAQICERLVELDQGMQDWRYRHVTMVERIIGSKPGTGGSSGASYLRTTLFRPMFPDLWAVRSQL